MAKLKDRQPVRRPNKKPIVKRLPVMPGRVNYQRYSAIVLDANREAAHTALAAISGKFDGIFSVPLTLPADDDSDPVKAWAADAMFRPEELKHFKTALAGLTVEATQQVDARKPRDDEEKIGALCAKNGYRIQGKSSESYGTLRTNGVDGVAQSTTSSYIRVNQWKTEKNMISATRAGQRIEVESSGTYRVNLEFNYTIQSGVEFEFAIVKGAGTTPIAGSSTIKSSDGRVKGNIPNLTLAAGDRIAVLVKSDSASSFLIISGKFRVKRLQ